MSRLNNYKRTLKKLGFNPFSLQYTRNAVDWFDGAGTHCYGPIWVIQIKGKWYDFGAWKLCKAGKLPERTYYYDERCYIWRLTEPRKKR